MAMSFFEAGEQANKKQRMMKGTQPVYKEDADIDRISNLPRDVLDRILELMNTHEAARTCVLSSKWRYIWANHPTLVLDNKFWYSMTQKRLSKQFPLGFFADTLNRMFVHHTGHINKFVLDVSGVRPERYYDLDLWLSFLSRRGVKVLKLENSTQTSYAVPSCVFSNSDLTEFGLYNCLLRTAKSTALHKLKSLNLKNVTLCSWVLVTPLLSSLTLERCSGIHHFIISAPRLMSLRLVHNDDLNLVPYLTCSDIEYAYIYAHKEIKHQRDGQKINLLKLLSCWPKILKVLLDGPSLKYLATGTVPEEFPFKLSLACLELCFIDFNLNQMAWVLCILQKSPRLHSFYIWFMKNATNELAVVNYLEKLDIVNQKMEQLRVVKMVYFTASRAELLFTKIMLSSAPSLERMLVVEDEKLDLIERLRISRELMGLPRVSPNAKIIFRSMLVVRGS